MVELIDVPRERVIVKFIEKVARDGGWSRFFNFLSIAKMLLDLQDGNLASFAYRLLTYIALFILGYLLQRTIRGLFAARRAAILLKLRLRGKS
jgi:hypothetical protein